MDSHPLLQTWLAGLGQVIAPEQARAIVAEERVDAFTAWFTGEEGALSRIAESEREVLKKIAIE